MKKNLISILVCITIIMAMILSGCSKAPQTLEEYVSNDTDAMEELNEIATQSGLDVNISENTISFTCDIKELVSDVSEEIAKSETMIEALNDGLDGASDTFTSICSDLEEESKIEGIQVIVSYTYDDETLVTKTFNKEGVVE